MFIVNIQPSLSSYTRTLNSSVKCGAVLSGEHVIYRRSFSEQQVVRMKT